MIMGPFLTLCFAFIPSETDIKQIRMEPGGGGSLLQEAIRDMPLDGVAFSRL